MDYRSWLQNYVNNHPDQNTRSQGQALINIVGDDMGINRNFLSGNVGVELRQSKLQAGINRNFLSGNVGNGGNFRKTEWFGNHAWVKGGNGALYKNDEISGINDRFKQLYYADQQAKSGSSGPQIGHNNQPAGYYGGYYGGGNRASAAQLAEYDQNNTCAITLIGVHCSYSPLSKDCVNI